jgi:hypothetical protein
MAVTLSDLSFDKSFKTKSEAQNYAEKQRKKYKYVRVVKAEVSSNVHRKTKTTFYRVYVGK